MNDFDPFEDLERLRISDPVSIWSQGPKPTLPRPRKGEEYIGAKLPWRWLRLTFQLGSPAIIVGLYLWMRCSQRKTATIRMNVARESCYVNLSPRTTRRGLRALERAQLVAIQRPPGQSLIITILELGDSPKGI